MKKEEFVALPLSIVLGIMWDMSPAMAEKLRAMEAPKLPRPPKFDSIIYRREGLTFASEYDLDGLRFWRAKKAAGTNPEYAEKNAKEAKALDFWIAWRLAFPAAVWSGERNRERVTAKPPSDQPEVYPRSGGRRGGAEAPREEPDFGNESGSESAFDDDDIPF